MQVKYIDNFDYYTYTTYLGLAIIIKLRITTKAAE